MTLSLEEGQLLALLGPSGCGKTTTLRMVAGLERPTSGSIVVGGETLADGSRSVEPEHRGLGMVFQSYALWPHMTVYQNVAYGLRWSKMPKSDIPQRVRQVLELVGMAALADRPVPYSERRPAAARRARPRARHAPDACSSSTSRSATSTRCCANPCASRSAPYSRSTASPRST